MIIITEARSILTIRRLCLIFGFFFFAFSVSPTSAAKTEAVSITGSEGGVSVFPRISYFEDPEYRLTVYEAAALEEEGQFKVVESGYSGIGYPRSSIWMAFKLHNPTDEEHTLYLEYLNHIPEDIWLFQRDESSLEEFDEVFSSIREEGAKRPLNQLRPVFETTLKPGETRQYFVKTVDKTGQAVYVDFLIWNPKELESTKTLEIVFYSTAFGIFLIIMLLSLILFISLRQSSFLYYSGYIFFSILVWGKTSGLIPNITNSTSLIEHFWIYSGLMVAFAMMFGRAFLQTKKYLPKLDILLRLNVLVGLSQIPLFYLGMYSLSIDFLKVSMLGFPLLIFSGLLRWRQGNSLALIFSGAWLLYTYAVFSYPFRDNGFLVQDITALHIPIIAAIVETTLLFITLTLQARQTHKANEKIKQDYLLLVQNHAAELGKQVEEKTRQLVSEKQRAEKEARTDALTNIANRRSFIQSGKHIISQSQQGNTLCGMIQMDADFFKSVNDRYGHAAGDEALRSMAQSICESIGSNDVAARMGGEEFAIITPCTDLKTLLLVAERIRKKIETSVIIHDEQTFQITCSFGCALYQTNDDLDSLLQRADKALYVAKKTGRNCVKIEGYEC
ncbi:GGDEF domain-containing protein [Marinomonas hwangdonensis]|uniref:diguanylate cyclase n=1 Tax=Marinomonas hwangdonensis TaxID=1053647 RepID=A0A3M8Q307_9GAMM|nr:GGDEF domain-containing protein [Marinomonas hwangdonensis]